MRALLLGLIYGTIVLTAGPAAAQQGSGVDPPTLQRPDANAPASLSPALPNTGETLSDKLDRGDGVIKPPAGIDPEIAVSPKDPNAGANMPVIRPPQNPSLESK